MSFYLSHTVLNKTFPRLWSKKHLQLPEWTVLARNGEKKKHEEAAKCGGEKGGGEETAPGANCTKPRQECREAGPLFLPSRGEKRDPETRATYLCGEG